MPLRIKNGLKESCLNSDYKYGKTQNKYLSLNRKLSRPCQLMYSIFPFLNKIKVGTPCI